jgi:hypothetical protein
MQCSRIRQIYAYEIAYIQNFRLQKYPKSQHYNFLQFLAYMYVTGILI